MANKILTVLSVLTALAAATLWFLSASSPIPDLTWNGTAFMSALSSSARLNQWAAIATGITVLLDLIARLLRKAN
jgi:hypothetical protein